MSKPSHTVVIGAGPAGYVCAIRLAQLGQQVTVIEKEEVGGTCLNVGCIPSKALIAAGNLLEKMHKASAMGIQVKDVSLDINTLVNWKSSIVKKLTSGVAGLLKNHNVTHVQGHARLVSKTQVEVTSGKNKQIITCDNIVIATGSVPVSVPGFDFDGENVWSSTEALSPTRIPKHLVVIGGGYIGLELGCLYRKLGSEVTVVEFTKGALPGQDADCIKVIERSLKQQGINLITEAAAKSYKKSGNQYSVTIKTPKGDEIINCDQILCTVGRKAFSDGLGLENVGLKTDERGFLVTDKQTRTSVSNIYAIGDIAGQPMLAHKGSREGLVAAAVIAGQKDEYDVRCVPAVIFTSPEMASVGLLEQQAKDKGHEIKIGQFPFAASGRAMSLMETDGFIKIIADANTDEVLGVHMVGPEVTELIAEATLAIEMGATAEDIARTIHAHPTLPEAMMEAAEAVHKMAVHIYQKR
ncbi:MAG: dihydrolipoyl dehydrogenase [Gammaproteobacteria bacterium]|nr:dihydrolipoyl dehydrogenase [Gammaproteobacteria bacterium]